MDNQPVNQPVYQPIEPMDQGSSKKIWIIGGVVVIIVVLAVWYYSTQMPATDIPSSTATTQSSMPESTQGASLSSGDSISDITADFNQTSDGSVELNQAAAASAQAVQGF